MVVEPFARDRLEDNLHRFGRLYCCDVDDDLRADVSSLRTL